jgi:hypothetical protein
MKLLLPFALFFVIAAEGHLRGDHTTSRHDGDRTLKKCKKGAFTIIRSCLLLPSTRSRVKVNVTCYMLSLLS